ncbi:MAG: hypothetical protein V3R98_10510 [Alphaproteobacteria bacterium]
MGITEPDVTLTDYALTAECAAFAILLLRRPDALGSLRGWFAVFFAALAAASLFGGTVHGFFAATDTAAGRALWSATLLAIGAAALAAWIIAARVQFSPPVARALALAAAVGFAVYAVLVLFVTQAFMVAIAGSVPASLFLVVVLALAYRRRRDRRLLVGSVGVALTLVAGVQQQLGIGVHPTYFNHNAVFHAIQAIALLLIFLSSRAVASASAQSDRARRQC